MTEHLRQMWRAAAVGQKGTFYRLHHRNAPWTLEPTSQEFTQTLYDNIRRNKGEAQPGYSAFANPWHVYDYVLRRRWHYDQSEVVEFTGTEVGAGVDGEPLVMPEGQPTRRMSWEDFEKWVFTQPMGDAPRGLSSGGWGDPEAYLQGTVKEYDYAAFERLTGNRHAVLGRTPDYGPDHPLRPTWYLRSRADRRNIIKGGIPTEAEARAYADEHGWTIVEVE